MPPGEPAAPAGPCEWCGGPQSWTIASGVMYVRCKAGCQSLFSEERVDLPRNSEEGLRPMKEVDGTLEKGRVSLREEDDFYRSNDDDLPF